MTRFRSFVRRMSTGRRVLAATGQMAHAELKRVDMIESSGPRSLSRWLYSLYWWAIVLGVSFLPTSHEEATIYFPAMLTLGVAWLLAMAAYAFMLSGADYSMARPRGVIDAFLRALANRQVTLPDGADDHEAIAEADRLMEEEIPSLLPVVLLRIFEWLAMRAAVVAVLGLCGLLVGPHLADFRWFDGWSHVSGVIALAAPLALLLVVSLTLPFIT